MKTATAITTLLFAAVCVPAFIKSPTSVRSVPRRQDDDEQVRRIWDEGLVRKRQRSEQAVSRRFRRTTPALPPLARGARGPARRVSQAVVGITLWRLRESVPGDEVREIIHESAPTAAEDKNVDVTPVRMEAETPLNEGARVRISVESSRTGYLYVVDRELYADGSEGRPILIFPTERTLDGKNRVWAGRPITIPGKTDVPPYFTVRPNRTRSDQVAETLLVIVSDQPLDLPLAPEAQVLAAKSVNTWERAWAAPFERIEQVGSAGVPITTAEAQVGGSENRELRQGDAAPQSVYRLRFRSGNPLLLKLKLPFEGSVMQQRQRVGEGVARRLDDR